MNSNVEFYEAFAACYERYYEDVDAPEAVRQWLALLEARELCTPDRERAKAPPSLVDIGCGPGWYLRAWHSAHFRVTGLDASPAMLRLAAANATAGPGTDIPLYCADITDPESLHPLTSAFDFAVSHFHFLNLFSPGQVGKVFAGCACLLKPGASWATDLSMPLGANTASPLQIQPEDVLGWRRSTTPGRTNICIQWLRGPLQLEENYWLHTPTRLADLAKAAGLKMAPPINWDPANVTPPGHAPPGSSRVLLVFTKTANNRGPDAHLKSP